MLAREIVTTRLQLSETVETECALVVEYVWNRFMEQRSLTLEDEEKVTQWRSDIEKGVSGERVHRFLGIAKDTRRRIDQYTSEQHNFSCLYSLISKQS